MEFGGGEPPHSAARMLAKRQSGAGPGEMTTWSERSGLEAAVCLMGERGGGAEPGGGGGGEAEGSMHADVRAWSTRLVASGTFARRCLWAQQRAGKAVYSA